MAFNSKLIPVIREGIEVIKMIFFKELKESVMSRFPEKDVAFCGRLAGAVLNELFGTANHGEPFATFVRDNRKTITEILGAVQNEFEKMRIPLTDALRMQFLCDSMEGYESKEVLERAEKNGILIVDRDLPLPHRFLDMVRRLGGSYNLVTAPTVQAEEP